MIVEGWQVLREIPRGLSAKMGKRKVSMDKTDRELFEMCKDCWVPWDSKRKLKQCQVCFMGYLAMEIGKAITEALG